MPLLFRKKGSLYVSIGKTQKDQVHISHREWKGMNEMQEYLKIKWEVISHREWKGMNEMQEYLKNKW